MSLRLATHAALGFITVAALSACGGGVEGGGFIPTVDSSAGGIWDGKDPISGIDVIGIVTETGEARFIRADGFQSFGGVTVSWQNLSGSYTGILPFGSLFPDGSFSGTGTVVGTVKERKSLRATFDFTTMAGTRSTGTGTFTYNALYDMDSALTTFAGNYLDTASGAIITIDDNGVIFSQDPVTSCVINGQVAIIDSDYNAYRVAYSFSNCIGAEAYLNGTTATGLGVLDALTDPESIIVGVSNGHAGYALSGRYPRA